MLILPEFLRDVESLLFLLSLYTNVPRLVELY